jgi:hypothetical protein
MQFPPEPAAANNYGADHIGLLRQSYQRLTGQDFGPSGWLSAVDFARAIYEAPFVLVSHGPQADPIFNYGNLAAQRLFELSWRQLVCLPSRLSAELPNREERARLLEAVSRQGFARGYEGIRISQGGRRFLIQDVTVWNLSDPQGEYLGQGALYSRWQFLD